MAHTDPTLNSDENSRLNISVISDESVMSASGRRKADYDLKEARIQKAKEAYDLEASGRLSDVPANWFVVPCPTCAGRTVGDGTSRGVRRRRCTACCYQFTMEQWLLRAYYGNTPLKHYLSLSLPPCSDLAEKDASFESDASLDLALPGGTPAATTQTAPTSPDAELLLSISETRTPDRDTFRDRVIAGLKQIMGDSSHNKDVIMFLWYLKNTLSVYALAHAKNSYCLQPIVSASDDTDWNGEYYYIRDSLQSILEDFLRGQTAEQFDPGMAPQASTLYPAHITQKIQHLEHAKNYIEHTLSQLHLALGHSNHVLETLRMEYSARVPDVSLEEYEEFRAWKKNKDAPETEAPNTDGVSAAIADLVDQGSQEEVTTKTIHPIKKTPNSTKKAKTSLPTESIQ
ncbi:hypothetical protein NEDG_01995 [Nematocida displodere]|uniref:Uncharacterized protein n=1 Tax=Nematocida displodere TaxID=1805483 RepID=A0A177EES1_9MICR|nr:hypothetical protein NEDG_01995 [Nematocida displodere]